MYFRILAGLSATLAFPATMMASPCAQPAWQEIRNVEAAGSIDTPEGRDALSRYRVCIEKDTSLTKPARSLHQLRLIQATIERKEYPRAQQDLDGLLESLELSDLLIKGDITSEALFKAAPSYSPTFLSHVLLAGAQLASATGSKGEAEKLAKVAMEGLAPRKDSEPAYYQAAVQYYSSMMKSDLEGGLRGLQALTELKVTRVNAPSIAHAYRRLAGEANGLKADIVAEACEVEPGTRDQALRLRCLELGIAALESVKDSSSNVDALRHRIELSINGTLLEGSSSTKEEVRAGAEWMADSLSMALEIPPDLRSDYSITHQVSTGSRLALMLLFGAPGQGDEIGDRDIVLDVAVEKGLITLDDSGSRGDDLVSALNVIEWLDTGPLANGPLEIRRRTTMAAAEIVAAKLSQDAGGSPEPHLSQGIYQLASLPEFGDPMPLEDSPDEIKSRFNGRQEFWDALDPELQGRVDAYASGEDPEFTFGDLYSLGMSTGDNINVLLAGWARCQAAMLAKPSRGDDSDALNTRRDEFYLIFNHLEGTSSPRSKYYQSKRWVTSLLSAGTLACALPDSSAGDRNGD